MNEFSQTSASELTLDEFLTVDLDALPEMDPPCYTAGRKKDQAKGGTDTERGMDTEGGQT